MNIITVSKENLEQEHICCAISNNKDCKVASKKEWLSERFEDGLIFMIKRLEKYMYKPELYAPSSNAVFWTDEHISKHLLEAHLNPHVDASSRKFDFINKSAKWISEVMPPEEYPKLLDLGCGAGLYAEHFASLGFDVTGVDFSNRFVDHAMAQTILNKSSIKYIVRDYLTLDFEEEFNVVSLIYCDFGALSDKDRATLLSKIYKALKPNGELILDVFTLNNFSNKQECNTWNYNSNGGFWSAEPYLCLESNVLYSKSNTELRRYIIQTDMKTECYNIWEHYFTKDDFVEEIESAGFSTVGIYDNIAGKVLSDASETVCGVFVK